jgi:hypothetical protein
VLADPPPPVAAPRLVRRNLLTGLAAAVAVALFGAPLGLLWAAVAPGVPVTQTRNGPVLSEPQPEQFIAADGWFSALGLGFGVLAALAVWWGLRRGRGWVGLVAVALGAIGAALLAWWLGRQIGLSDYEQWRATAAVGQTSLRPPDLRAGMAGLFWGFLPVVRGDLLVPAFGAVVTYTLLAGWAADSDLGAGRAAGPPTDPDLPPGPTEHQGPGLTQHHPPDPAQHHPPDQAQHQPPDQAQHQPSGPAEDQGPRYQPGYPSGGAGGLSSDSPGPPAPRAAPGPPVPGAAVPPPG